MMFLKLWWPLIPYIKLVSNGVLQALVTTYPLFPSELEWVLQVLVTTGPLYPGELECVLQALVTSGPLYPGEFQVYFASFRYHWFPSPFVKI